MKNILNKIYIHPLSLITLLIFILIGEFRFISYFMLLIIVHEIGHIITSLYFKWNIDKIIILPLGGLTKYNVKINTPLKEEFLVAISGVIYQLIFYILIKSKIDYEYFSFINYFILIFNLIPIYPLDGAKILSVILNKLFNFKNSTIYSIIISYISITILTIIFIRINKIVLVTILFLLIEVNKLYKERNYIFNKFLLERYLEKLKFKKRINIKNVNQMKKDYTHLFLFNKKYITEKEFLEKNFLKNYKNYEKR